MKKFYAMTAAFALLAATAVSAHAQVQLYAGPQNGAATGGAAPAVGAAAVQPGTPQFQQPQFAQPQFGQPQFPQPQVPQFAQPQYPQQPVYPTQPGVVINPGLQNPVIPTSDQNYNPYNPAINGAGSATVYYDQFGRPIVHDQTSTIFGSATNPGRNNAVAGSVRNVNRYERDPATGQQVHVTGQEWLGADGQWHGNLNRRSISNQGGVPTISDNLQIYQSKGNGG